MIRDERGNILFLILIAVALFAALSYAVISSSGSGGESDDSQVIGAARIVQYPSAIRTQIMRKALSRNISVDDLEFNSPEAFDDLSDPERGVFHPRGVAAVYDDAPADALVGAQQGQWVFNSQNEVYFVSRTGAGNNNFNPRESEIIAFLSNVQPSLCEKINEESGVLNADGDPFVPVESGIDVTTVMNNENGKCEGGCAGTIGNDVSELNGKRFGCFQQPSGTHHFYFVLVER